MDVAAADAPSVVMPGLVPGMRDFLADQTWMAGPSPAMTGCVNRTSRHDDVLMEMLLEQPTRPEVQAFCQEALTQVMRRYGKEA